ncbi:MAG TPA: hypothetical protein VFL55_19945 [Acetobacteraceae bacterium]|nr:hypothetical protein [Acetobacteraceae bacterium]
MERRDDKREAHIKQMQEDAQKERRKAEERTGSDAEVERELQTVRPNSDAPSRSGVTPTGTGADSQRG